MATTSVKVALRVRPLTAKETLANEYECLSPIPGVPQVVLGKDRSFTYDHVFWTDTPQSQLYEDAVAPLLDKFLEGFNATVLAYGQTGSGKTYSMGTGLDGNIGTESQGIVPRAISVMFDELPRRYPEPSSYSVAVSFLELYNEELIDLLNPSNRPDTSAAASRPGSVRGGFGSTVTSAAVSDALRIREDEYGNIVWVGVREESCASPEQLLGFLNKGSLCRTTGSTDMNMVSSRSHAIFSVTLRLNKVDAESGVTEKIMAKFHFVDLAGSERLKKTHAEGTRAKEGIAINSGLLALGNVISALGDESRLASGGGGHVPYRDSKLTRLLQDSLGGNSQTLMLACVSPADTNFQETLSTLKYANRARNIKNKVQINPQQGANSVEVQQLRTQISRLKLELATLKEQYGLSSGASGVAGAGGLISASSSAENLAKMHEQNSVFGSTLRAQVKDLQNDRAKLEVHIMQLQNRIKTIEQQLVLVQAERDALLMEKNGWSLPDRPPSAGAEVASGDDEDAMDTDGAGAQPPNPLLVSYLTKISELQHALADRETELVMVKQQAAAISAAAPSNGSSLFGGVVDPAVAGRKQFRFVLPGSAGGVVDDDVNATLLRAREQIRQDMKFLLDTSSTKGGSDAGGNGGLNSLAQAGEGGGQAGPGMLGCGGSDGAESVISELERPMVLGGALDVPTWAKTPSVVNGGGDEGGSSVSQSGGGAGANGTTQAPELLHRALHKIQADLAVKEELMTRLESTHREYLSMKEAYEDKLTQLQQSLSSVRSERDEALVRMQATNGPREKERDIRARYEAKVKQLLGEISNLRKNHIEATKAMTSSKKSEMMLRQLKLSVDALRAEKTRLLKKMREEADKSREQAQAAEREIQKLRRKERMATEMAKKYERNFELQKVLLKRRAEEIVASNQKLKSVTALLKRSSIQKTIVKPGSAPVGFGGSGAHRGSITSLVGDAIVRPDSTASDSSRVNTPHMDREQQELALTYRKHQLYKEMETVVTTQQQSAELEQLVSKRKRLTDEKVELLNERDRVVIAEAERLGKEPDPSAPQYMDDRLESIDAELQYVDMRIKAVQAEAASSDAQSSSANGGVSGYEAVVGLVRSLGADDAVQLLESIVDDFIQLQISARNQAMEVTRQETQIDSLRKNLLLMRKTAMKNAVDYEKRIKTMAVDGYLQQQQQQQQPISGATQPAASQQPPSSTASPYDSIMGISVFPDLRPPSSTSPIPASSRASSPAYSFSARRMAGGNDDDAMSVTSSTSGSPLKTGSVSTAQSDVGGPREHRSMSMSSGTSGSVTASSTYSTSTAPRRPRPQSATSDVFERLAKTYTVAAQAKIRDPGQLPELGTGPQGNAPSTGPSLTRRESHDRLQQAYASGSNLNLALAQIDEEHGHTSGAPWPSAAGSRTSGSGRRPASIMSAGPGSVSAAAVPPYATTSDDGSAALTQPPQPQQDIVMSDVH